ncbi:hypothetical protein NIE88_16705 [Sporolactobacillus shoreicorticis]|uniref:Uncharacterized protein n=1 Tax=Sporolactobacillus shoreicorticis TaxID=1923877 RepID=A0ABW5SA87_9BACL|nr:hypothetical protein [Sporolactobacillus shoreicorticis]MCO7127408.1 hypothetical protein [Sporolactobacillus shoreicorticis]
MIQDLPTNTKFYLRHKPAHDLDRVTYHKTVGYINVANLSKSRVATYKQFEGSWYFGKKSTYTMYQLLITKNYIYYNLHPVALAGAVKSSQAVIKNNILYLNKVTLRGDGTQTFRKLTQTLKLEKKNGKKILIASKPDNVEISHFHGIAVGK